jgi:hypothetical protein
MSLFINNLHVVKFDYKSNLNLTKNQIDVIFFLSAKPFGDNRKFDGRQVKKGR